ncbi:MAG: pyridoxamine 5'-phosphate oxidase family protein [Pseudomonadota bacterium]
MKRQSNAPSERTRLRRVHERGSYGRDSLHAVLDATPLCHVGYTIDGLPHVTPTLQWRDGDRVYWHGSSASRALRESTGTDVCLSVAVLDGLVLARSAFHHSANYRSVTVFGKARKLLDPAEKTKALRRFVDLLFPDRWDTLRAMTDQEVKATTVLWMPLDEASAKVRTGGPVDDKADYGLPIWAGVIPFRTETSRPIPDDRLQTGLTVPDHVRAYAGSPTPWRRA